MFSRLRSWFRDHHKIVRTAEAASLAVFFVVVVLQFLFLSQIKLALPKLAEVLPSVLVYLTNEERKNESLGSLSTNSLLEQAAQAKADDMAKDGYFAHVSPDGKTPWYWLDSVGYQYLKAGENLAVNFVDSEDVVKAWLDSPTHKANIMNGKYQEIGIATAQGEYKGKQAIFVVQYFGTQRVVIPDTTPTSNIAKVSESSSEPVVTEQVTTPAEVEQSAPVEEPVMESDFELNTGAENPFESEEIKEENIELESENEIRLAEENTEVNQEVQVLGAEDISNNEDITPLKLALASPRNLLAIALVILMIFLVFKLGLALHLRHPRLLAIVFTLIILIAILIYIINSGIFAGTVL